jgi:hypothetical protein
LENLKACGAHPDPITSAYYLVSADDYPKLKDSEADRKLHLVLA